MSSNIFLSKTRNVLIIDVSVANLRLSKGSHTVYCHRYHVVFATKYHYDVLKGELKVWIGKIIRQTCHELGVEIIKGVLSTDHVPMFIAVPQKHSLGDIMRRVKGRSSRRVQQEFPAIRKRYWGCHFWARGYFSTISGAITDDVKLQYLQDHIEPNDVSR